jgi:hypothetical protein
MKDLIEDERKHWQTQGKDFSFVSLSGLVNG